MEGKQLTKEEKEYKAKERKRYNEIKKRALEAEKTNFDRVNFFRGTAGFWITIDHSAVILANYLAERLKFRVNLTEDTDYKYPSRLGKVSLKNLDNMRRFLSDSKYSKVVVDNADFLVFELKAPISKDEFKILAEKKTVRRQFLEAQVLKSVPMPKAAKELRTLMMSAWKTYEKKTNKPRADKVLFEVFDLVREADFKFSEICREEKDLDAGIAEIGEILRVAKIRTFQLVKIDVLTPENATALYSAMVELEIALISDAKLAKKTLEKKKALEGKAPKKDVEKTKS